MQPKATQLSNRGMFVVFCAVYAAVAAGAIALSLMAWQVALAILALHLAMFFLCLYGAGVDIIKGKALVGTLVRQFFWEVTVFRQTKQHFLGQ